MKHFAFIGPVLALLLNACSAQATPTIDPAQVQASAIAAASTMMAQTQAAIPPTPTFTDTPEPSPTPQPSPTPLPTTDTSMTPTLALVPTQGSSNTGSDPCSGPLDAKSAGVGKLVGGTTGNVLLVNGTKASVTISLYLSKNKFGQCGYLSYVLAPSSSTFLANVLPYGCYYASAYVNDPKKPSNPSGGPACITGPDKTTFTVTADAIKIIGP